ncbi:DUF389 domain-containing protein [Nonomuraea maritima]|nr:DUF389 domain-containing protein [Nonomuraea maritima]
MLHLRLIVPPARTGEAMTVLADCPGVTNIVVLPGAAREPAGDVVLCDAARESANELLGRLGWLRTEGSIAVEQVDLSMSEVAADAIEAAPGEPDDAVVWEELAQRLHAETRVTWAYLVFLIIATQLSGIAVVLDSPVLIVGAMVLGPEFGAVAAVCFGLLHRKWDLIATAFRTLAVGFAVAVAVTFACAFVAALLGWIGDANLATNEEMQFIVKPDRWSFIVALLAGAAGVLSITAGKSSALVGVFISVTTVPAAGYAAVALALGQWSEVGHAALQLAVNVLGMVVSGTVVLTVQRAFWPQVGRRSSSWTRPPRHPYG